MAWRWQLPELAGAIVGAGMVWVSCSLMQSRCLRAGAAFSSKDPPPQMVAQVGYVSPRTISSWPHLHPLPLPLPASWCRSFAPVFARQGALYAAILVPVLANLSPAA